MPNYSTNATIPLTDLFDTFSIDFAGLLPKSKEGNRYTLIAVEHLTNWPIAVATKTATGAEVFRFVNEEIITRSDLQRQSSRITQTRSRLSLWLNF